MLNYNDKLYEHLFIKNSFGNSFIEPLKEDGSLSLTRYYENEEIIKEDKPKKKWFFQR